MVSWNTKLKGSYDLERLVTVHFSNSWEECRAVWQQLTAEGVKHEAIVSMGPTWVVWVPDDAP